MCSGRAQQDLAKTAGQRTGGGFGCGAGWDDPAVRHQGTEDPARVFPDQRDVVDVDRLCGGENARTDVVQRHVAIE